MTEQPIDPTHEPATPRPFLLAWLASGVKAGGVWSLWFVVCAYACLCVANGLAWTTELSPTYGLLIIRIAVAAALALVSVVTLVFHNGEGLLHYSMNTALLVFPIACVIRLLRVLAARTRLAVSPDQLDDYRSSGASVFAGFAFVVLVCVAVVDCGGHGQFPGTIYDYVLASPNLRMWLLGVVSVMAIAAYSQPGTERPAKEAETATVTEVHDVFATVVKRSMVLMMLADGNADVAEQAAIGQIFEQLFGEPLSVKELAAEVQSAQASGEDCLEYLTGIAPAMNEAGKELVLRAMIAVAASDGAQDAAETELLARVAAILGISPERVDELEVEMVCAQ